MMKETLINRRKSSAFTLIELLVVIAIIAILMGMLLPAIGMVKTKAQIAKARSQMQDIELAVKQYEADYGLLPWGWLPTDNPLEDVEFGGLSKDIGDYDNLMAILTKVDGPSGDKDMGNPRGNQYLGIGNDYESNGYVDPWGTRFVIAMDTGYNGEVKKIGDHSDKKGSIFIYSCGPNKQDNGGTRYSGKGGDIASWE